jgi:hypothetical protein
MGISKQWASPTAQYCIELGTRRTIDPAIPRIEIAVGENAIGKLAAYL